MDGRILLGVLYIGFLYFCFVLVVKLGPLLHRKATLKGLEKLEEKWK